MFLYDLSTSNSTNVLPIVRLSGHESDGFGFSFAPNHPQSLLSCAVDGSVCLWDIDAFSSPFVKGTERISDTNANGELAVIKPTNCVFFNSQDVPIHDISYHPINDDYFGFVKGDGEFSLCDTRTLNSTVIDCVVSKSALSCIAFHPSVYYLTALADVDGKLYFIDLRNTKSVLYDFCGHSDFVSHIEWSPLSPTIIASSSSDTKLHLWDLSLVDPQRESALIFTHFGHTQPITDFAWNRNTPFFLASVSVDGEIQFWNINEKRVVTK